MDEPSKKKHTFFYHCVDFFLKRSVIFFAISIGLVSILSILKSSTFNKYPTLFDNKQTVKEDILQIFGQENISVNYLFGFIILIIVGIDFILFRKNWNKSCNDAGADADSNADSDGDGATTKDDNLPSTDTNNNSEHREPTEENCENSDASKSIENQSGIKNHSFIDHTPNNNDIGNNGSGETNFIDTGNKDIMNDAVNKARTLCKKAVAFVDEEKFSEAIKIYLRVLQIYRSISISDLNVCISRMVITSNISCLYFERLKNKEKGIEYAKKTIELLKDIPEKNKHYIKHKSKMLKILKEV